MISQTFRLNDNSNYELYVISQKSKKYESIAIQISKVLDFTNTTDNGNHLAVGYKYIYEEINSITDEVIYARYMDIEHIKEHYPDLLDD